MQIIPSILVKTKQEFLRQIKSVENCLDMVQIDIADGDFVPNTTWSDPEVTKKNLKIDCELHLMHSSPLVEAKRWIDVKQVKRVLFHFEAVDDVCKTIKELKKYNWQVGIVLNPDTEIESVEKYIENLDAVMFMGVYPGFQGQSLIPAVLDKIKKFKSKHPDKFTEIDGAVNEKNLKKIIASGVDAICPGSAIFGNERSAEENVKRMMS